MSTLKTAPTQASPAEFLDEIPDETKRREAYHLLELMQAVTGERPRMWGPSIVGFGSFPYTRKDGQTYEWLAIGFSPRQKAVTLYLMSGVKKFSELLAKLGHPKTGKSCVYFPAVSDLDQEVLRDLIDQAYRDILSGATPDYS